ncbi:MAG: 16S rRNA (guanine(966)-N(2))-methyltransferase RsmD [Longicatena sp.]
MRIVAGEYRSRVIKSVEGDSTRPTLDKIKEAVFSRIGPYFDGGEMLDLFSGSGNVALEALSRGFHHATLCDKQGKAVKTIQTNIATLKVEKQCSVWKMEYQRALDKAVLEQKQFDLIYLDPPYKEQQIATILQYIDEHDLAQDDADIVAETLKEDCFEDCYGSLEKVKDVTYGITRITYFKKKVKK